MHGYIVLGEENSKIDLARSTLVNAGEATILEAHNVVPALAWAAHSVLPGVVILLLRFLNNVTCVGKFVVVLQR